MELEFDQRLRAKGARPRVGSICPVREQLFSELFNEVIRQVALEMPERGIMLLRVRDELRLRLMAMLAIQEYASGFGTLGGKKEEAIRDLETRHGRSRRRWPSCRRSNGRRSVASPPLRQAK